MANAQPNNTLSDHTLVEITGHGYYLFGGFFSGSYSNRLQRQFLWLSLKNRYTEFYHRFNGTQWEDVNIIGFRAPCPPPMSGHTAVVYDGKMFVFGGMNQQGYFNSLWVYSPVANSWKMEEPKTPLPQARCGHTAVVFNTVVIDWCNN